MSITLFIRLFVMTENETQRRINQLELQIAILREHEKTVLERVSRIEGHTVWGIRLIIGSIMSAAMIFMLRGDVNGLL